MIDKILAYFGYSREYEYVSVMSDKQEVILREYNVTITCKNGDVITVPFTETAKKCRFKSCKNAEIYCFDHHTIKKYVDSINYRGSIYFDFPNNTGIRNNSPIVKIEYAATEKVKLFNVYTETVTKKLKVK